MILTNDDVQEIIRILDASPFDELQIETDRYKLTLRRSGTGWTQATETARTATPATLQASSASQAETVLEPGAKAVRAPLVGTFYRAPKPGAAPFVEVGDTVNEDTVVAIIETMKLMNSVHAGAPGVVTEICAANAEFVEHGRILMKLRAP